MEFKPGQYVIYRNHKVCKIEAIEALNFASECETKYYTLRPCFVLANEKIYVPLDVDAPLRNIMTKAEIRKHLSELKQLPVSDSHERTVAKRESHYRQLLEDDDITSHLYLFKELYRCEFNERKKGKKLCVMDRRYQEKIEKILSEELAVSLNETPSESRKRLYTALN